MDKNILVIDDDESIIWVIKKALEPSGYKIASRTRLAAGLRAVQDKTHIVLLDLILPDGDGLEGLREIRSVNPDTIVIMITANAKMQSTITAMKEGAYDYIEKPFDIEELKIVIENAFRDLSLREELKKLKKAAFETENPQMIGKSPKMLKVFKDIGKVAAKDITVLITGESGTGKELVAKAIHYNSSRSLGPFIAINSASIPKDLLESELFGYKKGAFTGAVKDKKGKIEAANRGTLFLDEISELEPELQAKLLRFLQEKEFTPLGSNETITADARIIGASNKDLATAVQNGKFREDLYYRFNVVQIKLPVLRERKEDIPLLAKSFLREATEKLETGEKELSKDAKALMLKYDWPGNVRELENVIKRACVLSNGTVIENKDLLIEENNSYSVKDFLEEKLKHYLKDMANATHCNLYSTVLSEVEKALIMIVFKETHGNQLKTAKVLGINRNTLRSKIKEYKIK
ncbi:MAG: sigma-54-dependent Fis family transcriptional regulator [Nitrospiraceae bacterium]|nr:MAG: sigma-54-dependent Fis family transcriptional regulator [Nitrospiraceae bacterium]